MTTMEERWRAHVMACGAKSGLTCRAYAAKARVNAGTLAGWKSKLGEAATPASFVEASEIAATAEPEAGVVELAIGRVIVRLRGRFDADALDLRLHATARHAVHLRHARSRGALFAGPARRAAAT